MSLGNIFSTTDISASGLAAERLRMDVVANNIANAHSTQTPDGGPYRRQQVAFGTIYDESIDSGATDGSGIKGVEILSVEPDMSELPQVYQPGHPHADDDGMVTMPNVKPATEMVDLITASRAYEANLRVLRNFRQMVEQALSLMRGGQ